MGIRSDHMGLRSRAPIPLVSRVIARRRRHRVRGCLLILLMGHLTIALLVMELGLLFADKSEGECMASACGLGSVAYEGSERES